MWNLRKAHRKLSQTAVTRGREEWEKGGPKVQTSIYKIGMRGVA